jgi:hypothetical protein
MSLSKITFIFIVPILSIIGFILNLLSTIVFSLMIKNGQRDDMYKHLLLKSICEMMGCFFSTFYPMSYYDGSLSFTYIMAVWNIWFKQYIIYGFFMASIGFEIAATFSCAISIEKKMKWCEKRLSFWIWVLTILILSFGIEMFPVFTYQIKMLSYSKKNETFHEYHVRRNYLYSKSKTFKLVDSIIKDVIFLMILLSLNCYILFKLIQIGRRKRRLNGNNSNNQNSNRAETRKITMIIVLFLIFFLGHLPFFICFAFGEIIVNYTFFSILYKFGIIFLYFSYSASFLVYFAFNNNFRRLFLKIIHF